MKQLPVAAGRILAPIASIFLLISAVSAQEIGPPQGEVVLTVTGSIARTNDGDNAIFDMGGLKALPSRTIETSTPWTEGTHVYVGVSAKALAELVGAGGTTVLATALNDYQIEIPLEDFTADRFIIAYQSDGEPMSIRDKGPLWIMYRFDDETYANDTYYSRSIWQLKELSFQ